MAVASCTDNVNNVMTLRYVTKKKKKNLVKCEIKIPSIVFISHFLHRKAKKNLFLYVLQCKDLDPLLLLIINIFHTFAY